MWVEVARHWVKHGIPLLRNMIKNRGTCAAQHTWRPHLFLNPLPLLHGERKGKGNEKFLISSEERKRSDGGYDERPAPFP